MASKAFKYGRPCSRELVPMSLVDPNQGETLPQDSGGKFLTHVTLYSKTSEATTLYMYIIQKLHQSSRILLTWRTTGSEEKLCA